MKRLITSILAIGLLFGLSGCSEKKYTPKEVAEIFAKYTQNGNSDIFNIITKESDANILFMATLTCDISKGKVKGISQPCSKLKMLIGQQLKEEMIETSKEIFLLALPSIYKDFKSDFQITINHEKNENKAIAKNSNGDKLVLKKVNGFWKVDL